MTEIPRSTDSRTLFRNQEAWREFYDSHRSQAGTLTPGSPLNLQNVEMLDGLVDIHGEPVGRVIVGSLLWDPGISRLLIMGQPSAGKSTLLSQIDHCLGELAPLFGVPLERAVTYYDDLLREASRRKPPDPDTLAFNQRLVREILDPGSGRWTELYAVEGYSPKRVVLAEVPAVGYTQPKDRGVSAFETLAKETNDTLFLYVVAHPLSQRAGVDARFTVVVFPQRDVVGVLKRHHNIIIEAPGIDDVEALGRKIKTAFGWAARGKHIEAILEEMGRQFLQWHRLDRESVDRIAEEVLLPESYNPARTAQSLLNEFSLSTDPDSVSLDRLVREYPNRRSLMPKVEATFAVDRFRKLGIPAERAIVAFSPPVKGQIHLHIKA